MQTLIRFCLALVLLTGLPLPRALAESHEPAPLEDAPKPEPADLPDDSGRSELYHSGDYRISRPGAPTRSNFYALGGFQPVDPRCFSGVLTWAVEVRIPVGGGARFYEDERISLRPSGAGERFGHRHRWNISSDPVELMGIVTTSAGAGSGQARVALWVNIEYNIYRLVADVRPRAGSYQITTTGAMARTVSEDFHFGFGDHHYSYVDLSRLEAASAHPEVAQALRDIRAMLSSRPPNVYMGFFDWRYDEDGNAEREILIEDEDRLAFGWGVKGEGRRGIHIQITCEPILRRYESRWGGLD